MAEQAKQTPLVELLDAVPADVRIGVRDGEDWNAGMTWHPVGFLCHEAAAELRRLHDHTQMLEHAYKSACDIVEEQDKKLVDLEAVNQELLEAMISFTNSAYIKKHHPKRYAAAVAAIARAEGELNERP
jgi:hypothetical protein